MNEIEETLKDMFEKRNLDIVYDMSANEDTGANANKKKVNKHFHANQLLDANVIPTYPDFVKYIGIKDSTASTTLLFVCDFCDRKMSKSDCSEANEYFRGLNAIFKHTYIDAIFILQEYLKPAAYQMFSTSGNRFTWMFQHQELIRNITLHDLAPKTKVLNKKEALCFLEQKKIKLDELPTLLMNDATTKFYGWPIGTIVHYQRRFGGTLQPIDHWRVVKPNPRFTFHKNINMTFAFFMLRMFLVQKQIFSAGVCENP